MGENDYQAGYHGDQFHHGMDSAEYHRGKSQKELEDTLGGAGKKTEVPGVAYTIFLIAPMIWIVYPVLGITLYAVCAGVYLLVKLLHIAAHWGVILGLILAVMSFFWGYTLEKKASQFTVYRWIRGFIRIAAPLCSVLFIATTGGNLRLATLNDFEPSAIVGGFFIAVIAYLIFQRLDLIYFPAMSKIKKMQEQIKKGERPQRPKLKRLFYGICWLIPTVLILTLLEGVAIRLFLNVSEGRELFTRLRPILACINFVIWFVLLLISKLPGTGKYVFSKEHEDDVMQIETSKP